jgi:hypothetical protein
MIWTLVLVIYLAGLGAGLLVIDEPFPARLGVAAAWPVGPIAFVTVVAVLLAVLPIALPRAAVVLAAVVALVWWLWGRGW